MTISNSRALLRLTHLATLPRFAMRILLIVSYLTCSRSIPSQRAGSQPSLNSVWQRPR